MQLAANNNWSILLHILMQKYFDGLITVCVLWPQDFEFNLQSSASSEIVWLQVNPAKLKDSFENNIYNFSRREARDRLNNVSYNQLTKKLIAGIEQAHCEGFLAFQDDIPKFTEAFQKASTFSIWRSLNNRFLFAFSRDQQATDYFQHDLFKNQPNILVVEAESRNSSIFDVKTNKYVGSKSDRPEQLIHLSTFCALNRTFKPVLNSFTKEKLDNLQGREIVVGAFDYRPFIAIDFQRLPLYYDHAADNPSHLVHVDGTEFRTCQVFCELYNCTLQFDTSEKSEWGLAFGNYSGYGLIGSLIKDKIQIALGAMYQMYPDYVAVDFTVYLGRSGITCLVPTAGALVSWNLPLRPFAMRLWLAVMAMLSLEILVLSVARKFEQSLRHPTPGWWSCVQYGYATSLRLFVNQSSSVMVQSHTVRTFLFACYMFDIILTSVYGGGLSSILTLPTLGESADSVEKLARFNLPWTGSSYAWLEIINKIEGEKAYIYQRLVENFVYNSIDDMRSKAQVANMGFIVESLAFGHFGGGDYITPPALQRLKLMVDDISNQFTVAIVARLWPHLEKYNDFILQWHASGLDEFWEWRITADYLNANEQNQVRASQYISAASGPAKLNTQSFAGLILLWIAGILFSILVFAAEIVWFQLVQKRHLKVVRAGNL